MCVYLYFAVEVGYTGDVVHWSFIKQHDRTVAPAVRCSLINMPFQEKKWIFLWLKEIDTYTTIVVWKNGNVTSYLKKEPNIG